MCRWRHSAERIAVFEPEVIMTFWLRVASAITVYRGDEQRSGLVAIQVGDVGHGNQK